MVVRVKPKEAPTPAAQGQDLFLPINLESLRLESVPDFDLYFQPGPDQPFVLYCEQSTTFTAEAHKRLMINRVRQLYIKNAQRPAYLLYLADYLEDILADPNIRIEEKAAILYDSAQAVVEDALNRPEARDALERSKDVVARTVDFMTSGGFMLEYLLRNISCDYYLYTHSVNAVAYSVALAIRAGLSDQATLREIANGALLHDIGKCRIDLSILNKPDALDADEWMLMIRHPSEGHRILREHGILGEIALDLVMHHHEKLDGSGYPDGLEASAISPFVRILTIVDVFDALTTERFYQRARTSYDAIALMNKTMRNELDQGLLKCFIEIMGGALR
jgi:HD-GYP domain-containing protein (c-di-GMP phosphodiesterase class II)